VASVDSFKQNLASTFVNAFLNAGFGKDKILGDDAAQWIHKHKEQGKTAATAALGMIQMWDVENGLTKIDQFLYLEDDIKAGALLALGILNSSVRNECDPAQALLTDFMADKNVNIRMNAITSLALAYAGSNRADIIDMILPTLSDTSLGIELIGIAALAVGVIGNEIIVSKCLLIFSLAFAGVASCNDAASSTILEVLMVLDPTLVEKSSFGRFISLGLGLLFLGRQQAADTLVEGLKVVADPIGKQATTLLDICAYAGMFAQIKSSSGGDLNVLTRNGRGAQDPTHAAPVHRPPGP